MKIIVITRRIIRYFIIAVIHFIYTKIYKMEISRTARISFGTKLDKTYPKGIHIGEESYLASGSLVFSHDYSRDIKTHTYIGKRCFIGANVIILPGIKIGDEVVVGAGSVVTKDVESNSIVAGNPARVLKTGIKTKKFGVLIKED
jgi:acetyltransferase-like isoleucine patch superfamily enzyme